ncbi:hypothetical protein O0I10_012007 [Lichtheimia ornata]|uniref:Uncharacterized protein n=1 Tax=Lichtheimia ornata TaxID=688661 RepID=A0AAD7USI6_9FUNG|nr:uncharacterized protein O0I10_012007 [Lichtheimia ornata]KAJ8652336.1 hypothetical protein O0I10_012007 [Lichtheimia ornata]
MIIPSFTNTRITILQYTTTDDFVSRFTLLSSPDDMAAIDTIINFRHAWFFVNITSNKRMEKEAQQQQSQSPSINGLVDGGHDTAIGLVDGGCDQAGLIILPCRYRKRRINAVLIGIDTFSGWIEVKAMPNKTAAGTTLFILSTWCP